MSKTMTRKVCTPIIYEQSHSDIGVRNKFHIYILNKCLFSDPMAYFVLNSKKQTQCDGTTYMQIKSYKYSYYSLANNYHKPYLILREVFTAPFYIPNIIKHYNVECQIGTVSFIILYLRMVLPCCNMYRRKMVDQI